MILEIRGQYTYLDFDGLRPARIYSIYRVRSLIFNLGIKIKDLTLFIFRSCQM